MDQKEMKSKHHELERGFCSTNLGRENNMITSFGPKIDFDAVTFVVASQT